MKKVIFLIMGIVTLFATEYNNNYVDFKRIVNKNINGNIETIGNTIECVTNLKFANSLSEIDMAECQSDYTKYYNNKYLTKYINVIKNNPSIFNSSSALLKIPKTFKKIVWAAVFWQGHMNNYSYQYSFINSKDDEGYDEYYNDQSNHHKNIDKYISKYRYTYYKLSNDLINNIPSNIESSDANRIILFVNNNSYSLEADELDYRSDSRYFKNEATGDYETKYGVKYSAYKVLPKEVIDRLNSLAANNSDINITVANITTTFGLDERLGDYGAWSLVVIYEETPDILNFRNNEVYYGFKNIYKGEDNNHLTISINNLLLPMDGDVNSKLSIFSAEGEYVNEGNETYPESVRINGEYLDENLSGYDKYNVFDGRLSENVQRSPSLSDNDGIDIDIFDVSSQLTDIRDKEKNDSKGTYSVDINVSTYNDGVFLSVIGFSTQLYVPKVCYDDFRLYDKYGNEITSNTKLKVGEKIKVHFIVKNDESEAANHVNVFYPFDDNVTEYEENSTDIKNVLENDYIHINDNTTNGNLGVEVNSSGLNVGVLGDSNNEFLPYSTNNDYIAGIEFNLTLKKEGNLSFDFYTDYNYTVGNQNYFYKGVLPKCSVFENNYNVYTPKLGYFNVVEPTFNSSVDPLDVNDPLNALYTKIVNKAFNVKVIKLKDDNKTLTTYQGIVRLDLINNPKDESECSSNPYLWDKFVAFQNESSVTVNNISLDTANKNVRFRVKYFDSPFPQECLDLMQNPSFTNFQGCITNMGDSFSQKAQCLTNCGMGNMSGITAGNFNWYQVTQCFFNCLFEDAKSVCSRNNFAIRPYAFLIFGQNEYKRAGEDFNITLKAVDENNFNKNNGNVDVVMGVKGYNENVNDLNITDNFYVPSDDETKQMNYDMYGINDTNRTRVAYCPDKGVFNIVLGNNFNNGEVNLTMNYSENGILTLNISEVNGSEFAAVDRNDTNASQRFIKPATFIINKNDISQRDLLLEFIPYKFVTNGIYDSTTNSFVYMNEINNTFIPKMAAFLEYNITAQNKQGNVLKNFTKTCFPDFKDTAPQKNGIKLNTTFDLLLDADLNLTDEANLTFSEISLKDNSHIALLHTEYNLTKGEHHIQEWISPLNFENGNGKVRLFFNLKKDYRLPKNEVNITIKDINTSTSWMNNDNATKIFIPKTLNKTISFRYGRLNVHNVTTYNKEINTTIKYEYWKDDEWVVNKEHNDSFGYINITNPMYAPNPSDIKIIVLKQNDQNISKGVEDINISTTHALPYSAKIHLSIPRWLWYHPLAKNYKDPSSTNKDCLTHPCFSVNFQREGKGWGGISSTNAADYNETNRTSHIKASLKKINTNKNTLKKINW